jgi:hypothetical protein
LITLRFSGKRHLRHAKIQHLHAKRAVASASEEQVGWFEIAVNDAESVSFGQRLTNLQHDFGALFGGESAVAREMSLEVDSKETLHHDIWSSAGKDSGIHHARHVLALELCGDASLPGKPQCPLPLVERVVQQELDGDALVELEVCRCHDDAHPAAAKAAFDPVLGRDHEPWLDFGCHHDHSSGGALQAQRNPR